MSEVLSKRQYAMLVADMRQAQDRYFRSRTPGSLDEARRLERRVDRATHEIFYGTPSLFAEADEPEADGKAVRP